MKILTIAIGLTLSIHAQSSDRFKVIYGEDDRFEPYEVENGALQNASKAVAAIISNYSLVTYPDSYELAAIDYGDSARFCEGVPYRGQPKAARCSSFLIGKDIVVTAGHCLKTQWDCQTSSFVFDFRSDLLGEKFEPMNRYRIKKTNVYGCEEILERKLNSQTKEDWAIIKLKRPVTDREFLQTRKFGKVTTREKLALIGFPSGIPMKIATNGKLRKDDHENFFVAEIDAFHVNSGSPVINEITMDVEGILVRGEKDYQHNGFCEDLKICESGRCRGEDVTKILTLPISKYIQQN
ncbi:serine protease [Halobacteriovorax sp. HLS]|uniref:trypsin-like serine peptidase n=1 Tax=Halobacteriovorax sp. HLS TaxID=2234000 RepID=UPI000FD988E7|nr:serine protease [Halobacteriovorax sp. HLS]